MPPLSTVAAGLCAMRSVFGGATIIYFDDLVSLHGLVIQSGQPFLAVDDDTLASYSVFACSKSICSMHHNLTTNSNPENLGLAKFHGLLRTFPFEAYPLLWECAWGPG